MAQLELVNVSKSFGDTTVIHGLNLTVKHGEFCVFVGPSGCGKSTLLRMIAGLEECTGGDVLMDNDDVTDHQPAKRGIAMVFQSYALYPHMTVAENLGFGLKIAKVDAGIVVAKVAAAAKTLQIEHLLKRKPKDLSGGQRQRVAIGRAIVREPRMFLFDEPLSNLDAALRVEMRVELAKIKTQLNTTVVYVTHDQVEAMTLADKIVVLRDGRIEQVGSPLDLYASPVNQFVAGFIGSPKMNFLSGTALSRNAQELAVLLTSSATVRGLCGSPIPVGTDLIFGIRPEHLSVVPPMPGELQGDVFVVERLGGETYFHIRVADQNIIAKVDGDACAGVGVGSQVGLSFDTHRAHFFLKSGLRLQQLPLT